MAVNPATMHASLVLKINAKVTKPAKCYRAPILPMQTYHQTENTMTRSTSPLLNEVTQNNDTTSMLSWEKPQR